MQQSDAEAVKAAVYAIYAALSARDMGMMEPLWVHNSDVVVVNVRNKVPSIGWDACKKNWQSVFDAYSEVRAVPEHAPHIQFLHGVASATSVIAVQGKNKAGQPLSLSVLSTQIFVKPGDRWLAVAHHASRVPD
jgi:ketosteroid isomerase-like protein